MYFSTFLLPATEVWLPTCYQDTFATWFPGSSQQVLEQVSLCHVRTRYMTSTTLCNLNNAGADHKIIWNWVETGTPTMQ